MFCIECGTRVVFISKFCVNCGTKFFNKETVTQNNIEVISDANADDSENSDHSEIGSFFKSDPNYFKDLPNDVVIKAAESGNMYAQLDMIRRCRAIDDRTGTQIWNIMVLPERINIAKQGDFKEQISLGYTYGTGIEGVEKNENEYDYWHKTAYNNCMKAAEQGDAIAQCNMGQCFKWGYGTKKDIEEAIYWFEKAAEQGNSSAIWQLKDIYEEETSKVYDKNKADYWEKKYVARSAEEEEEECHKLKGAAEQGDACKQRELAGRYFNGNGVEKNTENFDLWSGRAFSGFKKAAEQGDARAQIGLGHYYWDGNVVQKDWQTALMWYRRAAEQGNNEAMWYISKFYRVEKNDYEFRHWLKKAAEQGNERALIIINSEKNRKDCKELLERIEAVEEKRKNILDTLNAVDKNPQDGLRNIMGSILNDVDIIEVMKNPKEAVLKFGFNAVKKMFDENAKNK